MTLPGKLLLAFLLSQTLLASPQDNQSAPNGERTTFRAEVRRVLVDVVVTDGKDAPVTGLAQDHFQVFEDGKPQTIASFEEHSGLPDVPALTLQAKLPPNVFSNAPLAKVGDAANVLLLDALNTQMQDQSYVHSQMVKYIKDLRPGTRLAIFALGARLRFVQGFTGDPMLLMAAVNGKKSAGNPELSPLLQTSSEKDANARMIGQMEELSAGTGANLQSSIDALREFQAETEAYHTDVRVHTTLEAMQRLALYLRGIPGRKNVIWFSGSFPLSILGDFSLGGADTMRTYQGEVAKTANLLAAAQIAIYPIGAQGISGDRHYDFSNQQSPKIAGIKAEQQMTQYQVQDLQGGSTERAGSFSTMDELARDTGGEALYNTNSLNEALDHVLNHGTHYYTLTYSPSNKTMDGRLRRIDVKVGGGTYRLAFRRGYYATDVQATPLGQTKAPGDPLRPLMDHGTPDSTEILYTMGLSGTNIQATPVSTRAGDNPNLKGPVTRYKVNFAVAVNTLSLEPDSGGVRHGGVELTLLGYDHDGNPVNWLVRNLQITVQPQRYATAQEKGVTFSLDIDVPPNGVYLRSGVYDIATGKAGTLEIPLTAVVPKANPGN